MKLLQLLKLKPVLAGIGGLALVGIFIFPGVPQARISLAALQAQIDALQNLFDDHESEQALQKSPTVYRWAVWSSYNQACCWYGGNPQGNASLFGGVFPQV